MPASTTARPPAHVTAADTYGARRARARDRMRQQGIAALLVSPGSDLAYLCGHRIHTSERLTCLAIGAQADALVVPELEAPRARNAAPGVEIRTWGETDDPVALVAGLIGTDGSVAVDDRMWASFVLRLQATLAGRRFVSAAPVTASLRIVKDADEVERLRAASASGDRAYARVRELAFAGSRERDISSQVGEALRAEGHDEAGFAIVASGPNGASPHHDSGDRVIEKGDAVVLDFGGTLAWYASDITRTVHVGPDIDAEERRVHDVVLRAQMAGYDAAREGATAESVDAAARKTIDEAGYGKYFIHRLGHGIGLDGHETPYLVRGNTQRLDPGMAFSIEPGIYLPGRFGVRIEDIAVLGADGRAEPLNNADRSLAIVN